MAKVQTYIQSFKNNCRNLSAKCKVYLKSKEFNLTNGLRKVKEENSTSVVEPEFLFELLTGVKMPNVSTMEELRKIFKIKSMNRSKDQIEQLKCSVSA